MPKLKFNARGIDAIKPPSSGQTDYWDAGLSGFILRVTYAGRKTWCVVYRHEGRKRRMTLGTYPSLSLADAREKANDALRDVAHDKDPATVKATQRRAETFGEMADEYIEKHAKKKKRSWMKDKAALDRDMLPQWRHRKATSITRKEVIQMLDDIVERGAPIQANRTLEIVRKIFNWAINRDIVEHNPCHRVERPAQERASERVLSENEIKALWIALGEKALLFSAAFRLRLLTAQRGQEIEAMLWEDIAGDWWTIPGKWTKNGLAHRVPLSPQAVDVLDELRIRARSGRKYRDNNDEQEAEEFTGWVFRSDILDAPLTNLWRAAGIRATSKVNFVPRDLRRTATSLMTGMGIPRLIVAKILNHVERGVTAVYDRHSYDSEKRQALDAWGARVEEIVTGRKINMKVVQLHNYIEGQ